MNPKHVDLKKNGLKVAKTLKKLFLIPLLAALPLTSHAAPEGTLETATCEQIIGWAWDSATPATRLKLDIVDTSGVKPVKLATVIAQKLRQDLLNSGKGDGRYGFAYLLPASIRNAKPHSFAVRLAGTATDLANSPQTTDVCYGKLNDTGIKTCSTGNRNGLACPVSGYAGQDGDYGRDAEKKLPKIGHGSAGFDYTKIANDGTKLPATAALGSGSKDWACTRDNVTGLVWEIKTADGGLRDQQNDYSWYNPDSKKNGGFAGYQNYGYCTGGISCDTQGYVNKINTVTLCGKKDWRLPKQSELLSIINYGRVNPAIDPGYFPNTPGFLWFWSSTPNAGNSYYAWFVNFYNGYDNYDFGGSKVSTFAVRLVRGGQ